MPEILLGQSYFLRFDPKLWEAMQPYPPLGTLYAAAYLRDRGHDVAVFDSMLAAGEVEWEAAIQRERPRFAVLYEDSFNYLSKMCLLRMREAAFRMIEAARRAGCTVIVSGSDATDHLEEYIDRGADYILIGEGEITLGELMDTLTGRTDVDPAEIRGLAFRTSGEIVRTLPRDFLRKLDLLPFPAWDLVDVERYRSIWLRRHGYFSMNLVTTRGCPYHCNWCAKPIYGQRYNARSPENVVDELVRLKERYAPDHVWFADDLFGLKPGWIDRFATLVEERNVRLPFKSLSRADLLLRGSAIESLRRAGADIVWIGAESGSQTVLDAMEKGTRVEQINAAAERLHEAGIKVGFFLQFGYPGETREDIERTLQMVRACRPDDIGASVSYPLPGTKFYEAVRLELGTKQNWTDSSDLAMLYSGPFSTDFYRMLHTVLHREFRAHKAWEELRSVINRPATARPHHLRRLAAMLRNRAALPIDRVRLNRLAARPHHSLTVSVQPMARDAAMQPTTQPD